MEIRHVRPSMLLTFLQILDSTFTLSSSWCNMYPIYILSCSFTPPENTCDSEFSESPEPPKVSAESQCIKNVLVMLCDARMSPFDLVLSLLNESNLEYFPYQNNDQHEALHCSFIAIIVENNSFWQA